MKKKQVILLCCLIFLIIIPLTNFSTAIDLPRLSLSCAAEVNEGSMFVITVTSGNVSIANATVRFNGEQNITNASGKVSFKAPRITPDENKTRTISASKNGYNTTTCLITILNIPQLFPTVSSTYLAENTTFIIVVVDEQGRNINNVTLRFQDKNYVTDENGTVVLQTPLVRKSETYTIDAQKEGYLTNTLRIVVSPKPSQENMIGLLLLIGICFVTVLVSIFLVANKYLKKRRINRR